jgi:hypothetical protein
MRSSVDSVDSSRSRSAGERELRLDLANLAAVDRWSAAQPAHQFAFELLDARLREQLHPDRCRQPLLHHVASEPLVVRADLAIHESAAGVVPLVCHHVVCAAPATRTCCVSWRRKKGRPIGRRPVAIVGRTSSLLSPRLAAFTSGGARSFWSRLYDTPECVREATPRPCGTPLQAVGHEK